MRSALPENVSESLAIKHFKDRYVVLYGDVSIQPDTLMFCTGYEYSFPFLENSELVQTCKQHVLPLFKHVMHLHQDTLFFMGIPRQYCPFPQFNGEAQFIVAKLRNVWSTPCPGTMIEDLSRDLQLRFGMGWCRRHAHVMRQLQWSYNQQLATLGQFQPIPKPIQELYDFNSNYRDEQLCLYKQSNYKLVNGKYVLV